MIENNIVRGYDNPANYKLGGQPGGPGGYYFAKPIGKVLRTGNLYYGLRNLHCPMPGSSTEICEDPKFLSEPRFTREQDLDTFNFHLADASPARHMGVKRDHSSLEDYDGQPRPAAGSFGAGALQ